jgi:hypothetical protein
MASATAVETAAATMEAATAVEGTAATAAESTTNRSASSRATGKPASSSESGPASLKSPACKSTSAKTAPSAEARTAPVASTEPVEPGSSSDKQAAIEPIGSIVTVGRAGIRCIPVISILTNGCSITAVTGPNSDTNSNPNLCLGRRGQRESANSQ